MWFASLWPKPILNLGANWIRPDDGNEGGVPWLISGPRKKLIKTLYLPKVTSHWLPRDRHPWLRGFVGDAQKLVTNSESLGVMSSTYSVK